MDKEYLEKMVENGEVIREMLSTPGWKILEGWIKKRITSEIEDMLTCSQEMFPVKRTEIKTLKTILQKTREYIEMARRAEEEILKQEKRSELYE